MSMRSLMEKRDSIFNKTNEAKSIFEELVSADSISADRCKDLATHHKRAIADYIISLPDDDKKFCLLNSILEANTNNVLKEVFTYNTGVFSPTKNNPKFQLGRLNLNYLLMKLQTANLVGFEKVYE